jgi:hypothetical protein
VSAQRSIFRGVILHDKEIAMPVVISTGDKEKQGQKPASQGSAAVNRKKTRGSADTLRENLPKILIGVVVVAVVFALFMYHAYVNPIFSNQKMPHKVAPMPGFADEYPYNTKEWQEAFKQGRTGYISGVPRPSSGAMGSPSAGGTGNR